MKKALLIAVVTLASASAHASLARRMALDAVNGAPLTNAIPNGGLLSATSPVSMLGANTVMDDVQDVFMNPGKMHSFGDVFTAEFGASPQGGIFRGNGDSKFGVYFNKTSPSFTALAAGLTGALTEQNAFEIFYGMKAGMKWGASLTYSDRQNKIATGANGTKTNTMGMRFGMVADMWEAYANLGLTGKADRQDGASATSTMGIRLGGQFNMESMNVYLDLQTGGGKVTVGAADTNSSAQLITVGTESKVKGEGSHFFYGVRYVSFTQKVGDNGNATTSRLPVYAGIEFDAASWLALRASISQSLLVNSTKRTTTANVVDVDTTGAADTVAAFGAGLKWGKAVVDGTLSAANGGVFGLDGPNFMANTSLTYNF